MVIQGNHETIHGDVRPEAPREYDKKFKDHVLWMSCNYVHDTYHKTKKAMRH